MFFQLSSADGSAEANGRILRVHKLPLRWELPSGSAVSLGRGAAFYALAG